MRAPESAISTLRMTNRLRLAAPALAAVLTAAAAAPPYYPVVADKELDCAVRAAAWNFSRTIQPERGGQRAVFDALQLGVYCGLAPPPPDAPAALLAQRNAAAASTAAPPTFFCDAMIGDDGGPGTLTQPFRTLERGLAACRAAPAGSGDCTLELRDRAPFVQATPLVLTAADSGLTFAAFPGETPVISGAMPLTNVTWTPYNVTPGAAGGPNVWVARGLRLPVTPGSLFVGGQRMVRARWPNANPETSVLPDGYSNATAWLPPAPPAGPPKIAPGNYSRWFDYYFPNFTWATGGVSVGRFEPPEGYWVHPHPPGGITWATPAGFTYEPARWSPRAPAWGNASTGGGGIVHVFHGEYWGDWAFPIADHDAAAGRVTFGPGGWQEARGWPTGGALYVENLLAELDAPGEWYYDPSAGDLYLWHNATAGTPPPADGGVSVAQAETLLSLEGSPAAPVAGVSVLGVTFTGTQPTFLSRPFRAPSGGDWSFADTAAVVATGTSGLLLSGCVFDRLGGNGLLLRGWNRRALVSRSTFTRLGDSGIVTAGYADGQDLSAVDAPVGTTVTGCVFSELGVYVKQAGGLYSAISANHSFTRNVAYNLPRAGVNINDGAFGGHVLAGNLIFNAVRETADHGAINTWDRQPYVQPGRFNPDGTPVLTPSPTHMTGNFLINSAFAIHSLDHDDGSNAMVDAGNVVAFAGVKNYQGFAKTSAGNLFVRPDFANATTAAQAAVVAAGGGAWPPAAAAGVNAQGQPVTPDGVPLPVAYYFPACARSLGQAAWGPDRADVYANNTCILGAYDAPYIYGQCTPSAPGSDGRVPLASGNTFLTPGARYALDCGGKTLDLAAAQAAGYDVGTTVADSGNVTPADVAALVLKWLAGSSPPGAPRLHVAA